MAAPRARALRIAVVGAGSIGSLFALKLSQAGHDVTLVVRNDARREDISLHGLRGRRRIGGSVERVDVVTTPSLEHDYDLVLVAVQRQQVDALVPTLAANGSSSIMFMFNCASGASAWSESIGAERLVWAFPAVLADKRDGVLEYVVLPGWARFAQITTMGRPDGVIDDGLTRLRDVFRGAGFPTTCSRDIDSWLKTHAAYMAPIMAAGYLPSRPRRQPGLRWRDAARLAEAMDEAFGAVRTSGASVEPANMRALDRMPAALRAALLWSVFCSPMAKRSLASHSGAAPGEVAALLDELRTLGLPSGMPTPNLDALAASVPERIRS